jgi:hypothetical protein
MESSGMMFRPNFMKIHKLFKNLLEDDTRTSYFSLKFENMLKIFPRTPKVYLRPKISL